MTLEIEVRSSGPGPRRHILMSGKWMPSAWWKASFFMGERWTRQEVSPRGRVKLCVDGVAIILRRST